MRAKINTPLKNLVLRLQLKNPQAGVRGLCALLAKTHKASLSKSAIANILNEAGRKNLRGRKKARLIYARKSAFYSNIVLLECIDAHAGLFEYLAQSLHVYCAKIKVALLSRIIHLISFAASHPGAFVENLKNAELARISGLYSFPKRKIDYFLQRVKQYKPTISLGAIRENLKFASTVKFYFENGTKGYCDARLSTLWDSPCSISYFFSPFLATRALVGDFTREKVVMINYTKSFDYLSLQVVNFIEGLKAGIRKLEVLDTESHVLETLNTASLKPAFIIGYYPKILNKGISFLGEPKRFRSLRVLLEEVLYTTVSTRFIQPKTNKGIILNSVLIKRKKPTLPVWGMLTDKNEKLEPLVEKYLQLWPLMEAGFSEAMKVIEKYFLDETKARSLDKIIPGQIALEKGEDFAQIIDILAAIFKEEIGDFAFVCAPASLRRSKDGYSIALSPQSGLNSQLKKKFNAAHLSFRGRRVFLQ
ncbi:MAG: hypothetical protein PHQ96_04025 [Candidatus Omnitrophica bacterium]|nr:hypothetical protein [Candidatus Omnitrophota bacterium]